MIRENCELNNIRVDTGSRGPRGPEGVGSDADGSPIAAVEVAKMDANVIMHLRPFDYMWVWRLMRYSTSRGDSVFGIIVVES